MPVSGDTLTWWRTAGFAVLVALTVSALPAGGLAQAASPSADTAPQAARCLGRPATIVSSRRVVRGTPGPDVIVARRASGATIRGLAGDDVICGGRGRDRVFGGDGDDRLTGGRSSDRLAGGHGRDAFLATKGDRTDAVAGERVDGRLVRTVSVPRRGTVESRSRDVASVSGRPFEEQTVVLAPGAQAPPVGGTLVVPAGTRVPDGLLGRVVARTRGPGGRLKLELEPAALDEAYAEYSTYQEGSFPSEPRARAAAFGGNFDCTSGSGLGPSVSADIDLSKLRWLVGFSAGASPYIQLMLTGSPTATFSAAVQGRVTCSMKKSVPAMVPVPGTPLTLKVRPEFSFSVDGSVSVRKTWTFHVAYGFFRSLRSGNSDHREFRVDGTSAFQVDANLEAFLGINLELALAGRVGVGGSAGPVLIGTRRLVPRPCTLVELAFRGQLTATVDVFFKNWTFALASATFGRRPFWDGCAGLGGSGGGGGGGGLGSGGGASPNGTRPGTAGVISRPNYQRVTPLAPTAGPAGYSFSFSGPECRGTEQETAAVRAAYMNHTYTTGPGRVGTAMEDWTSWVQTDEYDDPGTVTATVSCRLESSGKVRIGWTEEFDFTVTDAARPLLLGPPPTPGGSVIFHSGATDGPDPCPIVSGLVARRLLLSTGFPDVPGTNSWRVRTVDLPTTTRSEPMPLPSYAKTGDTATAWADCMYTAPESDVSLAQFTYKRASYSVGG
jgi:hypothetical protein